MFSVPMGTVSCDYVATNKILNIQRSTYISTVFSKKFCFEGLKIR